MFGYYLDLALRSLGRNRVLTGLMVLAIGLGIGASMTMITVLHVMSGDPLPGRSGMLFYPRIDARPLSSKDDKSGLDPSANLSWLDAMNLLRAHRAERQAAMASGNVIIRPAQADLQPFFQSGHYVTSDFFPMFGVPFHAGAGWSKEQDEQRERVVVLNGDLARKLFGDASAIGKTVRLKDTDFRVIGVLNDWYPQPTFYSDASGRSFGKSDEFFLPLTTAMDLNFGSDGGMTCWGSGGDQRTSEYCIWLQFWVQLSSPAAVNAYQQFLNDYWRQQQAHGRLPRPADARLYGLMAWLSHMRLIPDDIRMQLWLALGFLGVCMVNIVGLLLAKFMRRSGEVSVRRALGARRRDIFLQFGVESAVIGVAGGLLGLGLAQFGLWSVRQRPDDYAQLAQMDATMLLGTFVLAVVASVFAGMLPAWRACHITPALQLKTQ
ncbi:MAG: ABC transporter permease [Rhodanobacter sp.]